MLRCDAAHGTEAQEVENPEEFMKMLRRLQDPTILNTVTYNQLIDEVLPFRRTVIEGLLGTGTYRLLKSFLVAQIAYQVSTVLRLVLEDDKKRLQERMAQMFGSGETDQLHFAAEVGMIGKDLGLTISFVSIPTRC